MMATAFTDNCRKLVTKAFASAGWHNHKGIVPRQQVKYDRFLVALESHQIQSIHVVLFEGLL